eukprot:TRINITY_DN37_c0_g2_i4.p1 TRINITY_DN37_c0_g2~~TRINITY_DN37_c0_g2_i4.p1  ORF type:complete len:361 (+),score=61.50 TRINITY_DN37_c0_g2_i4:79-1161(+)
MAGPHTFNPTSSEGCVQIRDPMAKGDVFYDIPLDKIIPTAALKGKGHRSCLCRLFLKGRCGQRKKCKSYHVDPEYIEQLRQEQGVEIEKNFITEVVVFDSRGVVFAVRFPAVMRTKGLEEYKVEFSSGQITPRRLCASTDCEDGEDCPFIHVKEAELQALNAKRLRTPCCSQHGDRHEIRKDALVQLRPGNNPIVIPSALIAANDGAKRVERGQLLGIRDVCMPHITGRCKYGKSCGHLHICRVWWETVKPVESGSMPVITSKVAPQLSPQLLQKATWDRKMMNISHIDDGILSITPTSTPSVTPPRSPLRFQSNEGFGSFDRDESFSIPVWNEACPPFLGRMNSATEPFSPLPLFTAAA